MKRITRSSLIFIMAFFAMFTFVLGASFVSAKANTETDLTQIAFTVDESASARIGLKEEGGTQVASSYEENGIRFTLRMDKTVYEEGIEEGSVIFGAFVLPYDYITERGEITEDVFKDTDANYTLSEVATNGKYRIANVETESLELSNDGNSYYYNVSMVNLKPNNKAREFIAVPYLKTFVDGEKVYDIKVASGAYSMAYVAQLKIEETGVDTLISDALYNNYIKDLTTTIDVNLGYNYGDVEESETVSLSFNLGEEITIDKIKDALETNDYFNEEYHTLDTSSLKVAGVDAASAKVYANGKTNAEITVKYDVAQADSNAYSALSGYYTTENFGSIVLKSNGSADYNADLSMGGSKVDASYKLYKDGKMSVTLGNDTYFGNYEEGGSCEMVIGSDTYNYTAAAEVPASVYSKLRGYYEEEGGNGFAVVDSNRSVMVGMENRGNYIVSYDKDNDDFVVTSSVLGVGNGSAEIDLANLNSISIGGTVYNLSTTKTLASEEDYVAFAKTYTAKNAMYDTYNAMSTDKFHDVTLVADASGSVVWSGEEYSNRHTHAGKWSADSMFLSSTKYGNYVLFNDGTAKVYLPLMAVQQHNFTGAAKTVKDITYDATYDVTDGKLSLDVSPYWRYGINSALVESYNFTAVETDVNTELTSREKVTVEQYDSLSELYAQYAGTYFGEYEVTYSSYMDANYMENGGASRKKDGTMPMTITLNADGTFSGVGKTFEGTMNTAPQAYYDIISNSYGAYLFATKHLGNQPKTGTYTFKLIDGQVKIVLSFNDVKTSTGYSLGKYTDGTKQVSTGKDIAEFSYGYYFTPLWMGGNGVGLPGKADMLPSGWSGVPVIRCYNYASGVASDNTLSILFEAFSDSPITLTKQTQA